MNETTFFNQLIIAWSALAVVVLLVLLFIPAPYGRFARKGFGPALGQRLGWILMEAPAVILMFLFFFMGDRTSNHVAVAFLLLWEIHYVQRAFIYPFQRRGKEKKMTLVTVLLGILFNAGNCYLNGRYLFFLSDPLGASWFSDPRFILGSALFVTGFAINKKSDAVLHALRNSRDADTDPYRIPRGWLYERVSAPNYLGEIVEWIGWAVLTWSVSGLVFALWTAANLLPRAISIHRWYGATFEDYPSERKALIPFVL